MTGNDSASFPTDGLDPGTYVLVVRADREYKVIHPVVVAGYEPTVDTSGAVTPGESFTVEIDPDAREYENAPTMDSITVVRTEDGEAVEDVEATPVEGSDTYEAELTAPDEEGEVRLLTTVLGEESIAYTSEQEILGVIDTTLTESAFEVTIDEAASTTEVTENETVEIVADVENTGDFTGQETVELLIDGDAVDDATVSLNGSESDAVTLTHDAGDIGETSYTVSSSDSTDSVDVTVTESDETDGTDGGDAADGPENGSDTGDTDNGTTDGGSIDEGSDNETSGSGPVDDGSDTGETDEGSDRNSTDNDDRSVNGTDSEGGASNDTETASDDSEGSDGQDSDSSSDTDDDDDVIEPAEPTEEEASPVSAPLTGFPHFVAAVLVIGLLARTRRS
ncbi:MULTISPECIES: CARDB domain-containing protein [Halorubrum]|nr:MULTISPECIES: CARDB domain-containing protein [Halorubrum]TKX71212.1 hypothetical protein EXE40_08255 [Halorubrum sp. GN11GM_10-3_MGM]